MVDPDCHECCSYLERGHTEGYQEKSMQWQHARDISIREFCLSPPCSSDDPWTLVRRHGGAITECTWTKLPACERHGYSPLGPWCIWTASTAASTSQDRRKRSYTPPYLRLPSQVISICTTVEKPKVCNGLETWFQMFWEKVHVEFRSHLLWTCGFQNREKSSVCD